MAEPQAPEQPKRVHPTAETIRHLRHQIEERKPEAAKIFDRSGTIPTERELINTAGEQLRKEMESDYDPLTKTLNLIGYTKRKEQAVTNASNNKSPLTAVVIDLDDLKKINDSKGHAEGDAYLVGAADALRKVTRLTDIIARIGGDEFKVLLVGTDEAGANQWEERAREMFDRKGIKASFGLSPIDPLDSDTSFKEADRRMYVEKRAKKQPTKLGIFQKVRNRVSKVFKGVANG